MPNPVKAGLWTALFTFLVLFLVSAIGFLTEVAAWASSQGTQDFPSLSTLQYAAVSAIVAALVGLFNTVVRYAQTKLNIGSGTVPTYGDKPQV